ncbi:arylamine N-acetyltransferase family protein [Salinicola acroporae]|uniref:Arylamine N-acetyltransferase n=1 Tax=Salinicola acroporae TaxID=1541440 RepID=A0ABT6I7N8_9GAMM|nr:arylamine N-acetyltransferase [Salinicola acroporae]MDH4573691.1 arylamine N-acetyltransferase [Salinicola acroporae]
MSAIVPLSGQAMASVDLSAYLKRIGLSGALPPTLGTLRSIMAHHMASIPFEAIDVLLGREISLDPTAIDDKMLRRQRGGYCFEHTSLLQRVLQALGYSVEIHLARVWVGHELEGPAPAATHASLKVVVDDALWLVDVGFGSFMPNEPLVWQPERPQQYAHGAYRLRKTMSGFMVESHHDHVWQALYEVLDFPWEPIDCQMANHYVSRYPESHFRSRLMVAMTTPEARYTLASNRLKVARVTGEVEERYLTVEEMVDTLGERFGLNVESCWIPVLERIAASAQAQDEAASS